jgi:ABC-type transport system involved in multi-copper enzyme maturation permease subunit
VGRKEAPRFRGEDRVNFLPIVTRELAVAARRPGPVFARMVGAGAALALAILVWSMMSLAPFRGGAGASGGSIFEALVVILSVYCMLWGVRAASDSISSEKREGTVGLLFLTDLKGYDVVLGKLASASLPAVYGMLAIFPVLALAFILGGVEGGGFVRAALASVNTLVFSLSAGILASSLSSRQTRAALVTAMIIAAANLAPVIGASLWSAAIRGPGSNPLTALCPWYGHSLALAGGLRGSGWMFAANFAATLAYSAIMIAAACWITPRSWQDRIARSSRGWRGILADKISFGSPSRAKAWRAKLLDQNPCFWLAARDRIGMIAVWLALLVSLGFASMVSVSSGRPAGSRGFVVKSSTTTSRSGQGTVTTTTSATVSGPGAVWSSAGIPLAWALGWVSFLLEVWFVFKAADRYAEDRRTGALELILSTPLSVRAILDGHWRALKYQFAGPIFAVVALRAMFAFFQGADWMGVNQSWLQIALVQAVQLFVFVLGFWAMGWVAMSLSAAGASVTKAAVGVFLRIVVVSWCVTSALMIGAMISGAALLLASGNGNWFGAVALLVPSLASIGVNLLFGLQARRDLLRRFREIASRASTRATPPFLPARAFRPS